MNFNYETETDTSIVADKNNTKENLFRDDDMFPFDDNTIKCLQNMHF